jgi:hypothetical protein
MLHRILQKEMPIPRLELGSAQPQCDILTTILNGPIAGAKIKYLKVKLYSDFWEIFTLV